VSPGRRAVRVLLADDQPLLRSGFRSVLAAEDGIEVVGEAGDGMRAVDLARRLLPDVVVMDLRPPRLDAVAATRMIADAGLPVRVLIVAPSDLDEHVLDALRAGASGVLPGEMAPGDLLTAIRAVAAGAAVLEPRILRHVLDRLPGPAPARVPAPACHLDLLTEREREVLVQVARGHTNAQIAQVLSVSETTVKTHVGRVLTKLGLRDRVQAAVLAYESGLVRPGSRPGSRGQPGGPVGGDPQPEMGVGIRPQADG
jgi:DNA-binding NarL/FixJ family response regulator